MFSSVSREIGGRLLTLETGKLAQQAGGAIVIRYGESVLLVTATMSNPREGIDFFPLTVDFEERMYARGRSRAASSDARAGPARTAPSSPG